MIHLKYSLRKLRKTFEFQRELLKTEMDHDELDENKWREKRDDWLPYVENDVLCTAFSYAPYTKARDEITGSGRIQCLSLPGLGWKYFNNIRTEEDEPVYTFNDKHMRWFVQQSIKGRRVCVSNQYYKSKICDDILKIISDELNVNCVIYDLIEAYLEYQNKYLEICTKNMKVKLTIKKMRKKNKKKNLSMNIYVFSNTSINKTDKIRRITMRFRCCKFI